VELTHSFTVPTPVDETWAHFQDISALAECFPGAQVTGSDGDTFEGTCKVKLGPIALVYAGSGTFVERDEEAHRFVVDAKGKDKRGNGTAGAKVTLTMTATETGTAVEVLTDLAITGKPAQFGRGVMQDVSDKLLGQFVSCLEDRLAAPAADEGGDQDAEPASQPTGAAAVAAPGGDQDAGPASAPQPEAEPAPEPPRSSPPPRPASADDDDALDLGSALLPILLKTYGRQIAAVVVGLLVLRWVVRRARS
jgi:carbon monoxide dehydrogenase subunit G